MTKTVTTEPTMRAAKIIARSASAVIVNSGLTPTAEGIAAPSHT